MHTDTVFPLLGSNAFRRCLESLSQKWKFPSEPAVAKVPYLWKAIEFTEYTAACVPCRVKKGPRRKHVQHTTGGGKSGVNGSKAFMSCCFGQLQEVQRLRPMGACVSVVSWYFERLQEVQRLRPMNMRWCGAE